jgi:hypothetical protein
MSKDAMVNSSARSFCWLLLGISLLASTGATCMPWSRRTVSAPAPIAFSTTPTLSEVIGTINRNSAPVRQLQAEGVRISTSYAPSLKATLNLEIPRRLRIQGDFLTSRELDLGSNDELFWVWAKHGMGATLFARHDEFRHSPARELFPVEPSWLIEAIGVVSFDPQAQHSGPYAHGPGELEIHSQTVTPNGEPVTKVTVVHAIYGWVTEQTIRDGQGRMLASAKASKHRHYPEIGTTLPDVVDISIAPGQPTAMAFRVDVGGYRINQLGEPPDELFTMPTLEDYPYVNLADPRVLERLRGTGPQTTLTPQPAHGFGEEFRPQYRGYTR